MGYVTRSAVRRARRNRARKVSQMRRNGQVVITFGMVVWAIVIIVVMVALVAAI